MINLPVLVIAEDCFYLIVGQMQSEYECKYAQVFFIGHQPIADRHSRILQQGNLIRIIENKVLVYRGRQFVDVIETRADKFAPEIPFLITWDELTTSFNHVL